MELLAEIKQALREEFGISQEVNDHYDQIFHQIITDAKMNGSAGYTDNAYSQANDNVRSGDFLYSMHPALLTVYYKVFYVDKIEDFDDSEFMGSSEYRGKNFFTLYTTLIYDRSENKYIDLYGMLQHELEHVYQQIRSGKPILEKSKTKEIYEKSTSLILNGGKLERLVGFGVYYSFKFEKDAYANDIYRSIMSDRTRNPLAILKDNRTYRNVNFIKRKILDENNQENFEPIVKKEFGKSYKWFHNLVARMVREFTKKVGKILVKAIEDIKRENEKNFATDGGRMSVKMEKLDDDV